MILMRETLHAKHVRKWGKQNRGEEAKQVCGFRWNIASDDRNEPWSLLWPEIPHPPLAVSYWGCSVFSQTALLASSSHSPDLGKGSLCDTSRICYKRRESLLLGSVKWVNLEGPAVRDIRQVCRTAQKLGLHLQATRLLPDVPPVLCIKNLFQLLLPYCLVGLHSVAFRALPVGEPAGHIVSPIRVGSVLITLPSCWFSLMSKRNGQLITYACKWEKGCWIKGAQMTLTLENDWHLPSVINS